ncbi:hypothetical protein TrispH2_010046 [Trichoplax sp. H2]|nr:hypothetical protein TrispH2_010046 [Trichoplax sp. H2]|eukprot:RDD37733.1 hypothetical protein TrispH2_010046 [Trichoplax sp. H2]
MATVIMVHSADCPLHTVAEFDKARLYLVTILVIMIAVKEVFSFHSQPITFESIKYGVATPVHLGFQPILLHSAVNGVLLRGNNQPSYLKRREAKAKLKEEAFIMMKVVILVLLSTLLFTVVIADNAGRSEHCNSCIKQIQGGIAYMNRTSTRSSIKKFLTNFCSTSGPYKRLVIATISDSLNPLVWCQNWGSCARSSNLKMVQNLIEILSHDPSLIGNDRN